MPLLSELTECVSSGLETFRAYGALEASFASWFIEFQGALRGGLR
jgi:hypothetical protein